MKNRIYKLVVLCIFIGLGNACSLDEINKSNDASDTYFKSEKEYEEIVTYAYQQMRSLIRHKGTMFWGTDLMQRYGRVDDSRVAINDYTYMDVYDGTVNDCFGQNYEVITHVNRALNKSSQIDGLSQSVVDRRTGELLTLRAYCYFNLVENFGGVPLILDEITVPQYEFRRDTEEDVYTQIVQDLKTVITGNLLPGTIDAADFGRVGMGMAKHLLGKVLLTRSYKTFGASTDLDESISLFNDVLTLHPLASNGWSELFGNNGYKYNSSEVIFSVRYSTNQLYNGGAGNIMNQHFKFWTDQFPGNTHRGAPYYRHNVDFVPTLHHFQSYEDQDIRGNAPYLLREIEAGVADSDGKWSVGDVVIYFPKVSMSDTEKANYMIQNPTVQLIVNPEEYSELQPIGSNQPAYPMVYKFFDPGVSAYVGLTDDPLGTRDMIVYRSAETKLLLAEAYVKKGDPGSALQQINDLRQRAGATPAVVSEINIDYVLDESGRELFGEANRWLDLKRTGKLFERAWKYNAFVQRHHESASAISPHFLLRPIPAQQIDRTYGTLKQNPGYTGAE
ncbi:MAG: RagB/SusD family nutrient uptake outer membrane protein [Tannerellaceae bacterium]|nr:RagB/SusD family nutrient uptake outer membrane protein [Tannerellaceae bacterium]